MSVLLGIDAGSTVTKAVLFDLAGRQLAVESVRVPQSFPAAHHVERDQDAVWESAVQTVRWVLHAGGTDPAAVAAVGVTSHGDGLYLVDEAGRATRPGIMSFDSRARSIAERWAHDGTADRAHTLTGQRPWASAPATLLAWLAEHEPNVLARSRYALACKDMLRGRLTGIWAGEPTEASTSFTNVHTQGYDDDVLELFGLSRWAGLRPPIHGCAETVGTVSAEASAATGLAVGTPVAGGAHDVDCGAIGTGVIAAGLASVIAGSFNINQVVSTAPVLGNGWLVRNFVEPGRWLNMSISPTSSTNLEWFTSNLCAVDVAEGAATGDPFGFVEREIAEIAGDPSEVLYLPFLYGSHLDFDASGTFLGLRGWHRRGHLLRAVMEGITFTHRHHVEELATAFGIDTVRLTGGASRSRRWAQLFADVLGRPVEVTDCPEASALGAAQLAGIAAGAYPDLATAVERTVRVAERFEPGPAAASMAAGYERYQRALAALEPFWA